MHAVATERSKRPLPLRLLPEQMREWVYFNRYYRRYREWPELFRVAPLSACPAIRMHNLIPGDEISGSIAFNGFYDSMLTREIARCASHGGLFVDVGANMGYFALLWAGLSETGRAIAFEASPRNVALLSNNIRENHCEDRISLIPKAAGDRNGEATFDTGPAEQTGWGGFAPGPPEHRITVPMVRLEDELSESSIDVLKIDTEGADVLVLRGCKLMLAEQRIRLIFFEENEDKLERLGLERSAAQDFLREMNYESRPLGDSGREWMAVPKSA